MEENSVIIEVNKLLKCYYEEFSMAKMEVVNRLVDVAAKFPPKDFVNVLPTEFIEELHEISLDAPADPEDLIHIFAGYRIITKEEADKRDLEKRIEGYLGLTALHNYFHPNVPIPPFEERKLIGIINEIEIIDDKTVIIGDFESWMIRNYPIEIVDSTGKIIVTNPVFRQLVADSDQILKDIKQLDRFGLWLEESIKPNYIEIGSEVWVTRKKTVIEDLEKA